MACALALPARAELAFATPEEAALVLGARDEYVRATSPLERSAKLRTAEPVDEERFARHAAATVLAWTEEERKRLAPLLARLEHFLDQQKWKRPPKMLLVKASEALEDGLPHTRGNAIVLPQRLQHPLYYLLPHEAFHVLSRQNPDLREELYRAIGFQRCAAVELPVALSALRITNPDAPENVHAIKVRLRGREIEAMPFLHFASAGIDPRAGFKQQFESSWMAVARDGERCRVLDAKGVNRDELEGLDEQVGRNTSYQIHPEEILADNFAFLFMAANRATPPKLPSPEVPERIRRILTK